MNDVHNHDNDDVRVGVVEHGGFLERFPLLVG